MSQRRRLDRADLGRRTCTRSTEENENIVYYIPEEGGVRGSDTMVIFSGAKHPIAAHLFLNHLLDAQVSAANTNFIGYMGPNAAAKEFIDPAILGRPEPSTPTRRSSTSSQELLDLPNAVDEEYLDALADAPAAAADSPAPARPRRRRRRAMLTPARAARIVVLPGVAWLAIFFLLPLAVHPRRQPRDRATSSAGSSSTTRRSTTTREAFDPDFLPTFVNSLRYAALDDDRSRCSSATRSPTGSPATAGATRPCC